MKVVSLVKRIFFHHLGANEDFFKIYLHRQKNSDRLDEHSPRSDAVIFENRTGNKAQNKNVNSKGID